MDHFSLLGKNALKASNKLIPLCTTAAHLIMPMRCISCDKFISKNISMCDHCWSQCRTLDQERVCAACGYPLIGSLLSTAHNFCFNCQTAEKQFQKAISIFYHEGPIAKAVSKLKYSDHTYIAKFFAAMIASAYKEYFADIALDWICVPPMHMLSVHKRMYNQMILITRLLVNLLAIKEKFIPDLLVKQRHTKRQVGLEKSHREQNLSGSMVYNEQYANRLQNSTVLIIDDVMTTGATLNECAKVLRLNNPGVKVYGMTLTRTMI